MEKIDFSTKRGILENEMVRYIKKQVRIAGGSIELKRFVGFICVSYCGYEDTREVKIDEVKISQGSLLFHDADSTDEENAWISDKNVLLCTLESICTSVDSALDALSKDETFAENKREEFVDYVENNFPGYSSRIDWGFFRNLVTMENNLITQVMRWLSKS